MTKALVLAERADAAVELAAGARTIADEVIVVAIADMPVAEGIADRVAHVTLPEGATVAAAAATVSAFWAAERPDVTLVEPTRHMKIVAGTVAAAAGTSVITDAIALEGGVASSMYFGGVGLKKQRSDASIITVTPGTFAGLEASGANAAEELAWVAPAASVTLVSSTPIQKSGVDLTKADVVVAAGRGFATEEDLGVAKELAEKLGGGLGCSRPLTEGVNWLPTELYIGVSGLIVTPKVYIAAGISGQMQHMVGCNRSGVMFAINKDKNAPVFKQCDYGIIGDVNTVIPAIIAAL